MKLPLWQSKAHPSVRSYEKVHPQKHTKKKKKKKKKTQKKTTWGRNEVRGNNLPKIQWWP